MIRRATLRVHGDQRETFCCKYMGGTLGDRARRGFIWANRTDDGGYAWYAPREDRRVAARGERTDELTDEMGIALLCGSCFDTRQGASTA